ncbi:MAG: MauE/DoxX family redox-associated membrane protein [Parvicellaceae bacterium]
MSKKLTAIWLIRIVIAILFLVSAYAKIYHEPSAYFSITTFEAKQLVPLGFESGFAAYISRILIALEFSLGVLILLSFQLKRIVVPLTISVLAAFCFHLLIQIYLTGNSGNCGCFGALLPMTPLEAIIKNIFAIGLLIILNKLLEKKDFNNKEITYGLLVYLFSTVLIFIYLPIKSSENTSLDLKEFNLKESKVISGPDQVESEFGNLLPMADDGRLLLCFFAPGCDHCRTTIRSIDSLSRISSDFPKVEIVFMEEEVEKIPDFFNYAGNKFSYIVLDISTFYDVLTWERDTPGVFYMWNGNIIKEFNGINEKAFNAEELIKVIQENK